MISLRQSWSDFSRDFSRTVQRIKRLSATIESEVELARMRFDTQKYDQVLTLMASFHTQRQETLPRKSYYIPFTENPRFWGREDIISRIDGALFVEKSRRSSLRFFALCGMGGVGKTQIALRYANSCRTKYDAVFWVSADNQITIEQSFRGIARTLGLIEQHSETDNNSVILAVKNWFSSTGK